MAQISPAVLAEAKKLAGEISRHHAEAEKKQREYLEHAIKAGRRLDQLWVLLGKGEYGRCRKKLLPGVGPRMCRYYREAWQVYRDLGLNPATIAASDFSITGFIAWGQSELEQQQNKSHSRAKAASSGRRTRAAADGDKNQTSSGRREPTTENTNPIVKVYRKASKQQREEFLNWLPKSSGYKVVPQ